MTERPILFSAPMVRAILDGNKTQTRRICKPAQFFSLSKVVEVPDPQERGQVYNGSHFGDEEGEVQIRCPYGQPGDRLWVRETWQAVSGNDRARHIMTHPRPDRGWLEYAATPRADEPAYKWRPSIHMPRWASRITLEVTGVRVERLQDISEADAIAEGIEPTTPNPGHWNWRDYLIEGGQTHAVLSYKTLWESINGPGSWDLNPWVWVVEFKGVAQ